MKWTRVSIVLRIVCGLFGVMTMFVVWLLVSRMEMLASRPLSGWFDVVASAIAAAAFLFAAIVGKFPQPSIGEPNDRK